MIEMTAKAKNLLEKNRMLMQIFNKLFYSKRKEYKFKRALVRLKFILDGQ